MGLGPDNTISKGALVMAMRHRVEDFEPQVSPEAFAQLVAPFDDPSGNSEVQRNLGALGEGIRQILIAHAQSNSDSSADSTFFNWLSAVQMSVTQMRAWQIQMNAVLTALRGSVNPAVQAQIDRLTQLPINDPPTAAPQTLTGVIR